MMTDLILLAALEPHTLAIGLLIGALICIFVGYPVAFTLAGVSLIVAGIGVATGTIWDINFLGKISNRLHSVITNGTLLAIPFFIYMGAVLERSRLAEDLLTAIGSLFGAVRGGLAFAVVVVGALLAAATGVVGASVVAMGMISLPVMLRNGYSKPLATGTIAAAGTLGQIIPPSIVLIVLANEVAVVASAEKTVSVGALFKGALIPGLLLATLYGIYVLIVSWLKPSIAPALREEGDEKASIGRVLGVMIPPLALIILVLGSLFAGIASPSQAGALGAAGALLLAAAKGRLNRTVIWETAASTSKVCCMIMFLLIGAGLFNVVFSELEGDKLIEHVLQNMPGGLIGALILANLVIFVLGFFLDFFEIAFIVVPLLARVFCGVGGFGLDPIWFGVMVAINLQTSFLTPPFGFSLFYLKGVCPDDVKTTDIYKGVLPYIAIQVAVLTLLCVFPELVTWAS